MKYKLSLILIGLALLVAIISLVPRVQTERQDKEVKLIMSSQGISLLDEKVASETELLDRLKENGLNGVAVHKQSIENLVERDLVDSFSGQFLHRMELFSQEIPPQFENYDFDGQSRFFFSPDSSYSDFFLNIPDYWERRADKIQFQELNEGYLFYFSNWEEELAELDNFYFPEISQFQEKELDIVPVITDLTRDQENVIKFAESYDVNSFIFSGESMGQITSVEREEMEKTAQIMQENDIQLGLIEPFLAPQQLPQALAPKIDYNVLRTHIILEREMENYTPSALSARYVRSVRERNVRLLYLRPFIETETESGQVLLDKNLDFLSTLSTELKQAGYNTGGVREQFDYNNSLLLLTIIALGVGTALYLLLKLIKKFIYIRYLLLVVLGSYSLNFLGLLLVEKHILLRQFVAFVAAVVFPVLIILFVFKKGGKSSFLLTILFSLSGGLFVASALNHVSFNLQINHFRGVKLAFVLPLILAALLFLKDYFHDSQLNLSKLLQSSIKVKHLIYGSIAGIVLLVYIMRTGNYPLISVPALEIRFRELLEELLFVRPRFKEFLIGYPALILSIGLKGRLKSTITYYILLLIAMIAPITVINSFLHLHTPLLVSVYRTFIGASLGLITGLILLFFVFILDKQLGFLSYFGGSENGN